MLARQLWHKSLTDEVIMGAAERHQLSLDDPGFCLICGNEQGNCEPDARRYKCEACGEHQVYGAEELAFSLDPFGDETKSASPAKLWPTGSGDGE